MMLIALIDMALRIRLRALMPPFPRRDKRRYASLMLLAAFIDFADYAARVDDAL